MTTPDSVSSPRCSGSPARDSTPILSEHYPPNNLKYYNEHLNKSQFNSILTTCALRLLGLCFPENHGTDEHKLRYFIIEVLRRSKTTTQSLQICCYYLAKVVSSTQTSVTCPKKLFLGMIILASKFNQDHNYSFKTWLKVCGCSQDEENASLNLKKLKEVETACLALLDYKLYINEAKYENWCNVLLIFGYDFVSLHHVNLGILNWCSANDCAQKLQKWRRFLVRMDDGQLKQAKVNFKHYYSHQIGSKVITASAPTKVDSLFSKRSFEDPYPGNAKRVCT